MDWHLPYETVQDGYSQGFMKQFHSADVDSAYDIPAILLSCTLPIVPANLNSYDFQQRPPVSCNHMLPDSIQGTTIAMLFDMGVSDAAREAFNLYEQAHVSIGFTSPSECIWTLDGNVVPGKYIYGRMYNSQFALLQLVFDNANVEFELRAKTPFFGEALSALGMASFRLNTGGSIQ